MFSRSSSTITPSRISHSMARGEWLITRKVVRPAGTVMALGWQPLAVTVTVVASPPGASSAWRSEM